MSPQFAAGLTGLAGLCMVAGWVTAFRNRAYLGWLGFAFVCLSGFLWTGSRARDLGVPDNRQMLLLARVLLGVCLLSFALAGVAAVRETTRRLREIRDGYRAAEEALVEIVRASREKEEDEETPAGSGGSAPPEDDAPDSSGER